MMRGISVGCLGLVVLVGGSAFADEVCFCLGDSDDAVWYDCRTYHLGTNPVTQYECRPNPGQDRVHVEQGHTLQSYAADVGPCTPCKVVSQDLSNQMRNQDDSDTDSNAARKINGQKKTPAAPETEKGFDRRDHHE